MKFEEIMISYNPLYQPYIYIYILLLLLLKHVYLQYYVIFRCAA